MTLAAAGKDAVAQLAARFVFDTKAPAKMHADLAKRIEKAIADFKANDMQEVIARTLRQELERRIKGIIDNWYRELNPPQPYKPEKAA